MLRSIPGVLICLLLCSGLSAARAQGAAVTAGAEAERAFEGAQWVMASEAARAVAQVGARAAAGEGELARVIRERQELDDRFDALMGARAEAAEKGAQAVREIEGQLAGLKSEIAGIDARLARDFPRYAEIANPRPLGFGALRRHLRPGEGLVTILTSRKASYVWLVTGEGAWWSRAEIGRQELDTGVRGLRRALDPTAPSRGAMALGGQERVHLPVFDRVLAHELYRALLAPFEGPLAGVDHLYVVADGPLTSLPFSVMVTAPPMGEDDDAAALRDTAWLVRDLATTTLPAVSSLAAIRQEGARATASAGRFVGFGNPVLGTSAAPVEVASRGVSGFFSRGLGDVAAIRALSPLPGTERELRSIADILGPGRAVLHLGPEATETRVRTADLSDAAIIAFATHGLVAGELQGLAEPALVLTPPDMPTAEDDGLLTASEASALTLNADWVILSACNTAAGDGTPGATGLSGLARAFLFAGARSMLVSHWPVRDDVAAQLTARTLALMDENPQLGRARALQSAMIEVLEDTADRTRAHPGTWAPFVIVGEGG